MSPRFAFAALLVLLPAPSLARTSIGVTGGTLGVGPEIGVRMTPLFGLRANATFLSFGHGFDSSGVSYDGHLKLGSAGLIADLFPFLGGFRLSAGARYNGTSARAVATPTANASVGGQTFTPAQIGTLSGRAKLKHFAPQATIGWTSHGLLPGFQFGIEAGALFQDRARISRLTSSTGMIPQARLDAERDDLQNDVDKYRVYPIVQIAAGFRF